MDYIASACRITSSILTFLSVIRMTRLLMLFKCFRVVAYTFRFSIHRIWDALLMYIIVLASVAIPLYFWMGPYVFALHVSEIAVIIVMIQRFAPTQDIENPILERSGFVGIILIGFAVFCLRVLVYCMFAIIIVWGWRRAKYRIFFERVPYHFKDYLNERVLRRPIKLDFNRERHSICELYSESSSSSSDAMFYVPEDYSEDKVKPPPPTEADMELCRRYLAIRQKSGLMEVAEMDPTLRYMFQPVEGTSGYPIAPKEPSRLQQMMLRNKQLQEERLQRRSGATNQSREPEAGHQD